MISQMGEKTGNVFKIKQRGRGTNKRILIMHLLPPSLNIQVTGDHTVRSLIVQREADPEGCSIRISNQVIGTATTTMIWPEPLALEPPPLNLHKREIGNMNHTWPLPHRQHRLPPTPVNLMYSQRSPWDGSQSQTILWMPTVSYKLIHPRSVSWTQS